MPAEPRAPARPVGCRRTAAARTVRPGWRRQRPRRPAPAAVRATLPPAAARCRARRRPRLRRGAAPRIRRRAAWPGPPDGPSAAGRFVGVGVAVGAHQHVLARGARGERPPRRSVPAPGRRPGKQPAASASISWKRAQAAPARSAVASPRTRIRRRIDHAIAPAFVQRAQLDVAGQAAAERGRLSTASNGATCRLRAPPGARARTPGWCARPG